MKKRFTFLLLVTSIIFLANTPLPKPEKNTGKQQQRMPSLFAGNVVSTPDDEFGITFSPDEKTCYFAKKTASTITSSTMVICYSQLLNGVWQQPVVAPFSGRYKDFSPVLSPDGTKLFFISNRPVTGKQSRDSDIWFVTKTDTGWSEPVNPGAPLNSEGWELGCSVTATGTIFFSSTRDNGNPDIYFATFHDGKYDLPVAMDSIINSAAAETDPFISPDESYLIFASQGRNDALQVAGADSYPRSDLYISFKQNGKWTRARHMENGINSTAEESNPYVSPLSGLLYFTSERNFIINPMKQRLTYQSLEKGLHGIENGLGNIYSIPLSEAVHQ